MRVLIVDDQADARYLLQALLAGHGHHVASASNGLEALELARADPPDLIISDILMPVMDGFRLCCEIRKDACLSDTRFIFYTATYTERSDAKLAMAIGADDFIEKPTEPDLFLQRIDAVVAEGAQRHAIQESEPTCETEALRLYSERLVAKLEKRSLDLQREIAQRKLSETSLQEAYEIICQSPAVLFVWKNEEGWPVTYVTANVERLLGISADELLSGVPFIDLIHPDDVDRIANDVTSHSNDNTVTAFSHAPYRVLTASGDAKWVDDQTVVRRDAHGRITHYQGILIDVSDRIRAEGEKVAMEEHLRQMQKLESIGTLASGVAHEINNPLTAIINYADLIERRIEDAKLKAYAEGIIAEGDRIAHIVRNLLSFARQDREKHSPAHLEDIVDASLSLVGSLLRKDQISLEQNIPEDLPRVQCRSQQIQQVLINLLTNARDALNERYEGYHENKRLRITAGPILRDGERWVRATIEDHGNGIPDEVVKRIFDPFFTTKSTDKGTGLGLSISFGIIREHGGELTVDSVPGEYTRFHVELRALDE